MTHTKGNWSVRGNKIFIDDTYRSVATVHVVKNYKDITFEPIEDVEAIANAKLIADAPNLLAVLNQVSQITLTKSFLTQIKDLINNSEKKGICHMLVNDGRIQWVLEND